MNKTQKDAIEISRNMQNQMEEMFAGAHHEIKNLSYVISSTMEVLMLQEKDDKLKQMMGNIDKKITSINSTLSNLRDTVKDKSDEDISPLSVKEVLEDAIALCKRRFENHHTILKTEIDDDFVVQHKKNQLIQTILTVLSSSYDSVQKTDCVVKEIKVKVREARNKLQLVIKDSAPILSESEQKSLFNPTKNFKGRSGLSLLLVKDVIESNGGNFKYKVHDNQNTFTITFYEYSLNGGEGVNVAELSEEEILKKCV
jgi:signal transduction histidine kinase